MIPKPTRILHRSLSTSTSSSNRHRLFYTDILPPMLRVLAYGSASYFALHLVWNLLDREEERESMRQGIQDLKQTVAEKASSKQQPTPAPSPTETGRPSWYQSLWPFGRAKQAQAQE
ncbi:hypothetical protein IE53DRAFT_371802 [Violaceomyces palustris]|uniref:Uncharacterized protein n=1 Tax=Violaceomyces palustris TaxID=1673888 RepID=A0ACD0NMK0_9BASI|nr:hypothetical protein IE53DRAFT_371802 [Violaceomyces palustris]